MRTARFHWIIAVLCTMLVVSGVWLISPRSSRFDRAFRKARTHPGIRINESQMYISANPIKKSEPLTFWYDLTQRRRHLLREAMAYRFGSPGVKVLPEGQEPVELWTVEVTNARVTREVAVLQEGLVLYQREETVTAENMEELCSWTITSDKWADVELGDEAVVTFVVAYRRHYKTPHGLHSRMVIQDQAVIPVEADTAQRPSACPAKIAWKTSQFFDRKWVPSYLTITEMI